MEITRLICTHYPSLLPDSHREEILRLLKDLHAISYTALTFSKKVSVIFGNLDAINNLLARDDLTERYREALTYKLSV